MNDQCKILVVDDNPVTVKLLCGLLEDEHIVGEIEMGEDCVEKVLSFNPDILLLDVVMPEINGYDVCRRLREIPELIHLKILIISIKSSIQDKILGYEAGADDYIAKPFHNDELKAKIRSYNKLKKVETDNILKSKRLTNIVSEVSNLAMLIDNFMRSIERNPQVFSSKSRPLENLALAKSKLIAIKEGSLDVKNVNS